MSVSNYPGVSFKYQGGNYFVGTGTPVGTVGDLWSDTTTGVVLKVCTTAPSTWESVEGGAGSFTDLAASGTLTLSGVITPTQLAANTDNWAPTGLSGAAVIRVSTDASRNLTGITGGAAGRILILQNVGSFDLVLMNDVTSTAANRFLLGADITVATNKCAILQYDTTSSRWRGIATPSASSGQGNWIAADAGAAPTVAPTAAGADAISIGDGTTAAGASGIVIGGSAVGGASANVINIGTFANSGVTAGAYSVTIGSDDSATDNAQAAGAAAIAIGSSGGSTGNAARAAGANAIAVGSATGAIDGPIASGANAVAVGSANATTAGALASTTGAIAVGSAAEADGTSAIGIGYFANSGITAGAYSICIGADNDATDNAQATGAGGIAIGSSAGSTGNGARASAANALAIGCGVGTEDGANANAVGAIAIGRCSQAGNGAAADNSISIGSFANFGEAGANGFGSIVIGGAVNSTRNAQAIDDGTIAIGTGGSSTGNGARASGDNSIAIGSGITSNDGASSTGGSSIAIGRQSSATQTSSIAIGRSSAGNGDASIAVGYFANSGVTAGAYSVCIGADNSATDNAQATGASAIAIGSSSGSTGDGARATGANSIVIGGASGADSAPLASGTHSVSIGNLGSATRYGEFNFGVTGATASLISKFSLRGTTTDATPTEIFIRGTASNRITIASDTGAGFIATCTARRTDADGECAFFKVEGGIDNNAGTTAGFGATPFVTTPVTTDFTTATVAASADNTNDALVFTVTGEAAKTINWLISVEVTQITG